MNQKGRGLETSEDILKQRDAFRERVRSLEAALRSIGAELDTAVEVPHLALLATLRAGSIVRRCLQSKDEPAASALSGPSLRRARPQSPPPPCPESDASSDDDEPCSTDYRVA